MFRRLTPWKWNSAFSPLVFNESSEGCHHRDLCAANQTTRKPASSTWCSEWKWQHNAFSTFWNHLSNTGYFCSHYHNLSKFSFHTLIPWRVHYIIFCIYSCCRVHHSIRVHLFKVIFFLPPHEQQEFIQPEWSPNDSYRTCSASAARLCITSHNVLLMNSWTQHQNNSVLNKGHQRVITLCLQLGNNKTLEGTLGDVIQFALAPVQLLYNSTSQT